MSPTPFGEFLASFAAVVAPDGGLADDGRAATTSPEDELVAGAIRDLTTAALIAGGRRWACRGDQDLWHEGDHSEAGVADGAEPVRLDSFVRAVYRAERHRLGRPPAGDVSALRRVGRGELAHAVAARMADWTDAHLRHMFGRPVAAAALAAALDRLGSYRPPAVEYFRRVEPAGRAFTGGRTVLAGDALPLAERHLAARPHDAAATRSLYARTDARYEVPPAPGERAEALG